MHRPPHFLFLLGLGLFCWSQVPAPVHAQITWTLVESASFETGTFSEWDATSSSGGSVSVRTSSPCPFDGTYCMHAHVNGAGGIQYARAQWTLPNWQQGTLWRTEFALYLPTGFYLNKTCTFQPFGWDTYPTLNKQMRLMVYESDNKGRMVLVTNGSPQEITSPPFTLTESVWHTIAVEQKLHNTDGWTKVYIDNTLVAQGTGDTWTGTAVTRMRYGFADCSGQSGALDVWVDKVRLYTGTQQAAAACP